MFGVRPFAAAAAVVALVALAVCTAASATSSLPLTPTHFGIAAYYPVGSVGRTPEVIATADLNHDGHLDLAVTLRTGSNPDEVAVLLGKGDGKFGKASFFPVEQGAGYVAAGDVNGDGNVDLFVSNEASSTVSELLGDGQGGFAPQQVIPVPPGDPKEIRIANLFPGSPPDLIVRSGTTNELWIGESNGSGGFPTGLTPAFGGPATRNMDVAELEGASSASSSNRDANDVLYTEAVSTADDLHPNLVISHGPELKDLSRFTIGINDPAALALADFNGDGALDVVVNGGGQLSALLCVPAASSGSVFCQYPQHTLHQLGVYGNGPLAAGDFNGDGHADVLSGDDLLLGDGYGDFAAPTRISYLTGTDTFPVAGDFDGDGRDDVARVLGSSVMVSLSLVVDARSDLESIWRDLYKATPMQTERGASWKQKTVDALESAIDDPDCWTATGAVVVSTKGLLCLQRLLVANNRLTYGDRTELLPSGEKFVIRISRLLGEIARARFDDVFGVNGIHGIADTQLVAWWKAEYHLNYGDANTDRVHAALSYVTAWRILITAGPDCCGG